MPQGQGRCHIAIGRHERIARPPSPHPPGRSIPLASARIALLPLLFLFAGCASSAPEVVQPPVPVSFPTPEVRRIDRPEPLIPIPAPPAARQMQEGYWLGAMIDKSDVAWLRAVGIRVVISAVRPSSGTLFLLDRAGIEHVSVPMSDTFRYGDRILEAVDHHRPQEIFIHCRHGADRTGVIAAFLLVVRHGWKLPDAFYSVLYRHERDIDGLDEVLRDYGIDDSRATDDPSVGFYSVAAAGGIGGLKARNARYARLIATTIDAIFEETNATASADSDGRIVTISDGSGNSP